MVENQDKWFQSIDQASFLGKVQNIIVFSSQINENRMLAIRIKSQSRGPVNETCRNDKGKKHY